MILQRSSVVCLVFFLGCSFALLGAGTVPRVPWTDSRVQGSPEPPPPFTTERVFPRLGFTQPIDLTFLPGTQRMVVAEQAGKILSFEAGPDPESAALFFDARSYDPEIRDVFGLTFHPRFEQNRFVFIWTNLDTKGKPTREDGTRIIRFRVSAEPVPKVEPGSAKVILSWLTGGHNGGSIRFGSDGMLYISTGDGAPPDPPDPRGTGQDVSDLLSSVLRIDVDQAGGALGYGIPADNPFVSNPKARGEVWAYGLRNPWRMSFNPKNGELFVGDVGWELWEMIYRIKPAGNYGWSLTEGSRQDVRPDRLRGMTPVLPPLVAHSHEEAASITGGEFYHGTRLPELAGAYIYGDWQMGTFWSLRTDGDRVLEHREICRSSLMPAAFGIGPDGELLICDHSGGGIWRLGRNPRAGRESAFPRTLSETGLFTSTAAQIPAAGVFAYSINASRWADHATSERWVAFPNGAGVAVTAVSKGVSMSGQWKFPEGTVLAKTYSLEMERGNPATRRRIETQLLHYDGSLWGTYSYRWNAAQTDAELVPARGDSASFTVKDSKAAGGAVEEQWRFFSRAECARCHSMWNNFAPGFNTLQLDKKTAEAPGRQTDILVAAGLIPAEPRLTDPHSEEGRIEVRARSYLHANCATCHRYNGGGAVPLILNIETANKDMRVLNETPVQGDLGLPDARLIARGDPARSVLLYRMATGGRGHMPYLGGSLVDERGLLVVRDWIASLNVDPKDATPVTQSQRSIERQQLSSLLQGDAGALDSLLSTSSGALSVMLALVDGSLPSQLRQSVITKGSALTDPVRRDLFERFLPASRRRKLLGTGFNPEVVLRTKGDASRGKSLFAAACAACHQVAGGGIDFGPALDRIGIKWNREALLEQILEPSKFIDAQWQFTTLELTGGGSNTGFLLSRTPEEVLLKTPGGTPLKVPASQVLKVTASKTSAMPEGLLQGLTALEAADLLEYLASLR